MQARSATTPRAREDPIPRGFEGMPLLSTLNLHCGSILGNARAPGVVSGQTLILGDQEVSGNPI
jgi:hypothetical protein